MKHSVDQSELGVFGEPIVEAIQKCVHCGFCLPTCPTYQELGQEMDSPRGRIILMKEVLENEIDPETVDKHIDQCLGCVACETACPSGVEYGALVSTYRAKRSENRKRGWLEKLKNAMVTSTLPYPNRFRWAMRVGWLARPMSAILPAKLRPMLELVPDKIPKAVKIPELSKAVGKRRARVALLAGCAQQVLQPEINLATIRVLNRNGVEVVTPKSQGCCGALNWHVGDLENARSHATRNLSAFPKDVDAIITNAAGCGSGIHEYKLIFKGTEFENQAIEFANLAVDVSVFLDKIGLTEKPAFKNVRRIAYHDACHLVHAQSVRSEPRRLLNEVEDLEIVVLRDSDTCCGSAGTYNIDQPEIAAELGKRKADAIVESGCDLLSAGNIGCLVQIKQHLAAMKSHVKVAHTIEVLNMGYE